MKRFFITEIERKYSRYSGSSKVTVRIYMLKRGVLQAIDTVTYNTGSTRGAVHEAMTVIANGGHIAKKYANPNLYYRTMDSKSFTIQELN